MSDTPPLLWSYDHRVRLYLTGDADNGAAVGWDSLRQHYCRVVYGGSSRLSRYHQTHDEAIGAAEAILASLRRVDPSPPELAVGMAPEERCR